MFEYYAKRAGRHFNLMECISALVSSNGMGFSNDEAIGIAHAVEDYILSGWVPSIGSREELDRAIKKLAEEAVRSVLGRPLIEALDCDDAAKEPSFGKDEPRHRSLTPVMAADDSIQRIKNLAALLPVGPEPEMVAPEINAVERDLIRAAYDYARARLTVGEDRASAIVEKLCDVHALLGWFGDNSLFLLPADGWRPPLHLIEDPAQTINGQRVRVIRYTSQLPK